MGNKSNRDAGKRKAKKIIRIERRYAADDKEEREDCA